MSRALLFPEGPESEPLILTRALPPHRPSGANTSFSGWPSIHPEIIPIEEIDPGAGAVAPLCRELTCAARLGPSFSICWASPGGGGGAGRVQLWRNPQARREVIGQVLEYAGLMRRLSYGDLSALVAARVGRQNQTSSGSWPGSDWRSPMRPPSSMRSATAWTQAPLTSGARRWNPL